MTIDAVTQSSPVVPTPLRGHSGSARDPIAAASEPQGQTPAAPITREQLQARVAEEARRFEQFDQSLTFRLHEDTQQLMVQVVDRGTGRVLRETPPKEFLDLTARLREMVGFFLDETR
jgi:uncharacterized FlaG/YvyC family protein